MERGNKKQQNRWKWAFFILLLLNGIIVVFLLQAVSSKQNYTPPTRETSLSGEDRVTATAALEARDLQTLIQSAILQYEKADRLSIYVTDQVMLEGSFALFGLDVPFIIAGEPYATQEGDLQIKVESISVGRINLPNRQVLSVLASQLEPGLPLSINSEEEMIVIHLSILELENEVTISLVRIDKESQEYTFDITMPKENLIQ